ncbi:MAG TPA: DUF1178 family protein [Croceibacterium sp.]|nr:DUF1178 family protein [Croceibacterium sp.]
MIVYDLCCEDGHRFEGWFGSSDDYAGQRARGLVTCPECGSAAVDKAPMAPAVPRKGNSGAPAPAASAKQPMARGPMPPEVAEALAQLAEAQARALKDSRWVGEAFAEQTRAMHYGERDPETIHGQASVEEAQALFDEGIPVAPLPFPVAPPEELN